MNKPEALQALSELPQIQRISAVDVRPTDVIVIESKVLMPTEVAERIKQYVKDIWPNNRCVVLFDGLELKVIAGDAVPK